jgi:hypothetical protein
MEGKIAQYLLSAVPLRRAGEYLVKGGDKHQAGRGAWIRSGPYPSFTQSKRHEGGTTTND